MNIKKYEWVSQGLHQKHKKYANLMLSGMVIALACLFFLPESLKVWNLLPLLFAMVMWLLSVQVQSRDSRTKQTKNQSK